MYQTDPPRSPKDVLPTMYGLPSEDPEEPGLLDQFHILQPRLLDETFCPPNYPSDRIFVASDTAVEQQRQFAEIERQHAERLIAQLRSLGVEPDLD